MHKGALRVIDVMFGKDREGPGARKDESIPAEQSVTNGIFLPLSGHVQRWMGGADDKVLQGGPEMRSELIRKWTRINDSTSIRQRNDISRSMYGQLFVYQKDARGHLEEFRGTGTGSRSRCSS